MIDAESNVILRRPLKRLGGLRPFPLPSTSPQRHRPDRTLDNVPNEGVPSNDLRRHRKASRPPHELTGTHLSRPRSPRSKSGERTSHAET